jgi:hypothetical protein
MENWTLLEPTKKSFISNLGYNPKKEDWFYMPNSIFEDLQQHKEFKNKSSFHIAFAYNYYFLISWLWRYAKYQHLDYYNLTENKIYHAPLKKVYKTLLGVSASSKQYDYIIKKNGVLAQLGYIQPSKVAPIGFNFFDPNGKHDFITHFIHGFNEYEACYHDAYIMENEMLESLRINRKSNLVDYPIRGFYRTLEDMKEGYENGTFVESANTHAVRVEAFLKCLNNEKLGLIGFYLWSYLCYRTDQFKVGYLASRNRLIGETRIKKTTLNNVLFALEQEGMIRVKHEDYVVVKEKKEFGENKLEVESNNIKHQGSLLFPSNTYWGVRDNWEPIEFIKKGRPISLEEFQLRCGFDLDQENDIDPFSPAQAV